MTSSLPTLLIERCAQVLEKAVIPKLTDDFASGQVSAIAKLLHSLAPRVERKGKELMMENEGMKEVMGNVLTVLRTEKTLSGNAMASDLTKRLDLELQKDPANYADFTEENHRLKGALVDTIKGLDALNEQLPVEKISSLRQKIRVVIRQQLHHDLAYATLDLKCGEF